MLKKMLAVMLVVCSMTFMTTVPAYAATLRFEIDNPYFTLDGETRESIDGIPPFMDATRTMVPLRTIAEALGAYVSWDFENGVATIDHGGVVLTISPGETLPYGMGMPVLESGRIFVPLDYITYAFGLNVRWDGEASAAYVYNAYVYNIEATLDAFAIMARANEALVDEGSVLMSIETIMFMTFFDDTDELVMEMRSLGSVAQIIRSETDIDIRIEMVIDTEEGPYTTISYFRDGVFYLYDSGEWLRSDSLAAGIPDFIGLTAFDEQAVRYQMITEDGSAVFFILDGTLTDNVTVDLGIPGDFEIEMGNVQVLATFDGYLPSNIIVHTEYILWFEDFGVYVESEIRTDIVQLGGVTIEFPEALDEAR